MPTRLHIATVLSVVLFCSGANVALAGEFRINGHTFSVPGGFEIDRVAGPPLIDRPITASFDEQGRLYVSDSSGSNVDVAIQARTRPHRIVRLEDTDADGRFDTSVVFVDALAFPEGTLWHEGSLYVAAPPEIWKFTDADGDGRAEQRQVWFDGQTLTHCANDLHGPYAGPDGWLYWCKGAFAEQTYERPGQHPLVTKAAHIFRRRPQGGAVEHVMTGGMDNPVDVVFTPGGERIFSTTFLTRPHDGRRDGLIHAVYGGVYGKQNAVLDAHPHTGSLMPVLDHLGAAAPCGLTRLKSDQLGADFRNNLLTSLFNMQKVTRHILAPAGASFTSRTVEFLRSDNRDFHPTDVIEDADGSVIVVDTGGWYKLCCPTSQLWKPDIPGAIYRIRRTGGHALRDPRGEQIEWGTVENSALCELLDDSRWSVRDRAVAVLAARGTPAVASLARTLRSSTQIGQRRRSVQTLTRIHGPMARAAVRGALSDDDATVRQAALHAVSLWRDAAAEQQLVELLNGSSLHNRRAAAEALGRIGLPRNISALLSAAAGATDRVFEHSGIYAVIEIGDAAQTRSGLGHRNPLVQRAALIALDQMPEVEPNAAEVLPFLRSENERLKDAAWTIVARHEDWASALADVFRELLHGCSAATAGAMGFSERLSGFTGHPAIQAVVAEALVDDHLPRVCRRDVLKAMASGRPEPLPESWQAPLASTLASGDPKLLEAALSVLYPSSQTVMPISFIEPLQTLVGDTALPPRLRLRAMSLIAGDEREPYADEMQLLCDHLTIENSVELRSLAVDVLRKSQLGKLQLAAIIEKLPDVGPMELRQLLKVLTGSADERLGLKLVDALAQCPAVTSLRSDELLERLKIFGAAVGEQAAAIVSRIQHEHGELLQKLEAALELSRTGDVRRGQTLFHGTKAVCAACHAVGYLGGRSGPDLTRIGRIRSERDLLESILFPNASFVRSYEPTTIVTIDGHIHNGVIVKETGGQITLQLDAQKVAHIPVEDVEQRLPGTVSIMNGQAAHASGTG